MKRSRVLKICYEARTRKQIAEAWIARSGYLADHPGDGAVLDMGEMLSMYEEALDLSEVDDIVPAPFPVVPEDEPVRVGALR